MERKRRAAAFLTAWLLAGPAAPAASAEPAGPARTYYVYAVADDEVAVVRYGPGAPRSSGRCDRKLPAFKIGRRLPLGDGVMSAWVTRPCRTARSA